MDGVIQPTWLDRVKQELAEVKPRFEKLDSFLLSEAYGALPHIERTDLCEQWRHMDGYVSTLERRIARGEAGILEGRRQAQEEVQLKLHLEGK